MKVDGVARRSIRESGDGDAVLVIDQTCLPDRFAEIMLMTLDDVVRAIATMQVRGAPLIGITAAYGLALALREDPGDLALVEATARLAATRPTAVNLRWALDLVGDGVRHLPDGERAAAAWTMAGAMAEADVTDCDSIGRHGAQLLLPRPRGSGPLQVLTHCNAGWLAAVDWGTALAPVYRLHNEGTEVHVWVSETRPRNQGLLTAWELGQHGVPHTVVVDSAASWLMRQSLVDVCLVGADRITRNGDVCNKIGTALKALAAADAGIPFYVAAPSSSIDWNLADGGAIPIEERAPEEISAAGTFVVRNPGFDVTPARLVTALITECGVCDASTAGLAGLFGEEELN